MDVENYQKLGTVWTITPVMWVEGGLKERHPCPFPVALAERLVRLFSNRVDTVLDPFCGTGTTNYVASRLGRKTVGYDVEKRYVAFAKERCPDGLFVHGSSETMTEIGDGNVGLCVTSPPYLAAKRYSKDGRNLCNQGNPLAGLERIFREVLRVLKKGGFLCVNVSDVPARDRQTLTMFPYDVLYLCRRLGFALKGSIVWHKGEWINRWKSKGYGRLFNHEYVWVLEKP